MYNKQDPKTFSRCRYINRTCVLEHHNVEKDGGPTAFRLPPFCLFVLPRNSSAHIMHSRANLCSTTALYSAQQLCNISGAFTNIFILLNCLVYMLAEEVVSLSLCFRQHTDYDLDVFAHALFSALTTLPPSLWWQGDMLFLQDCPFKPLIYVWGAV